MSVFSKILESISKNINKELDKHALKNASQKTSQNLNKQAQKEANKATIKGDNFITTQSNTPSKSDYTTNITLESWVRQVAGIHPSKQVKADLEALYKKHPEMFAKPSEVYKLINEVKTNPQFFYTNNQPNIALIGKMLENGKLGKIGIQKDHTGNTIRVQHATKATKAQKDNERLLKRSDDYPLVERTTSTYPHSAQTREGNRPNGANALSKDNQSNSTKNAIQKQDSSLDFLNDKAPLPMERE